MTAIAIAVPDPYIVAAIDDELEIARLLGYRKLERPSATPGYPLSIWGIAPDFVPTWSGSTGRGMLPAWRRGNDCFELIALCQMIVTCTDFAASATCPGVPMQHEIHSNHPTPDHAIRYAMCKAAIAYLTARSKERGA